MDLFKAVRDGDIQSVSDLLNLGVDSNSIDDYGYTAIIRASREGRTEIVELLLQHGANPNSKDILFNWTALMYASQKGYSNIVYMLLGNGADPFIKNSNFLTALDYSSIEGHDDITILLKHYMMVYKMQRRRRRNLTHRRTRTEAATRNLAMSRIFEDLDVDDPLTRILRRETLRSIYG